MINTCIRISVINSRAKDFKKDPFPSTFLKIRKILHLLSFFNSKLEIHKHWQNLSEENAPKVRFCRKKMKTKLRKKKSITNHDSFWYQKLLNITFMSNTHFNFFWELTNMLILAKMLVPYCKMKSQQIQHFNMVHPRDISLAESRGSSRFLST